MRKGRRRRRVCQVIRRHVYGLHRGDGTVPCGRNPLLQSTHLRCQGGLVAYRRGHTPQKRRYFRPRLGETENVVNEQQHVLVLPVPEMLRHGQPRQRHAHPGSRRLIHLPEYHGRLIDNPGFLHLIIQVVPFPGTLAYPCKHRDPAVFLGDVVDQLLDQHGLSYPRAPEQADLPALCVGGQQVNDLDPRLKDHRRRVLVLIVRRRAVDRIVTLRLYGALLVNRLAQHIEQAP